MLQALYDLQRLNAQLGMTLNASILEIQRIISDQSVREEKEPFHP